MRPATLTEAYERVIAGDDYETVLAEFLDTFYLAAPEMRSECLHHPPPLTGNARLDALAGAVAEYLSRQYKLPEVPAWVFQPERHRGAPPAPCAAPVA
jgi:hypothetical protein